MDRSNWDALVAYMQAVWSRELSPVQRAAGWKLLAGLSNEAVEGAIAAIAEEGADRMPVWPLVLKTARSLEERIRDHQQPQLPAHDSLSDSEHEHVLRMLRARQTPEQRRRADRMAGETRMLPMKRRIAMAGELLMLRERDVDAGSWDALFEQRLGQERMAGGVLPL